ncbi:thioredoxin domain-containing protein [Microbacterium sp. cx-55]|uniref:DsbA family protein n=1 Tax=unclassified Microbacterium TaxID=2609290 RepID=UPI001CBC6C4D|nr:MULTISPECIES: thioredoxin domain-containing protein [unclassified Microbacterium]MBZ4488151.1 thioredoxin domain-containing protein [Microbacterium sp. cx-55]MCC4908845.1 thioredoxin domain-containing protein [Microbacterium sp. cx-59]UGB34439.1 thioredoxin domain-containing protein [Microbacterium sp. cx-55]
MSNDDSNVPAQRDRREAVREKAQQVRARHTRLSRIRLGVLVIGAVVMVGAVVGAVVFAVGSSTGPSQAAPVGEDHGGFAITSVAGVALGSATIPDAAATAQGEDAPAATPTPTASDAATADIRVYVDYLAPGAKQFELANAPQLSGWVTEGAATLTYYPVAMLTAKSNGTKYSLRAAGAAACVASHSPDKVFAFNHALLDAQPDANSDGLSDADLATLAQTSGVTDPKGVRACIEGGEYMAWAKTATDQAVAGIPGTDGLTLTGAPMILVNGEPYLGQLDDPKEFAQFVLTTSSESYYKSPTATPTPTPSS